MDQEGIHNVTIQSVYKFLQSNLPADINAPYASTIKRIFHKHVHLRFKSVSSAMTRYIDPVYNEKRLWVSRLLA